VEWNVGDRGVEKVVNGRFGAGLFRKCLWRV